MANTRQAGVGCIVCCLVLWVILNGCDAVWLYFYIKACTDPNPRTAVNRTHSGFEGYEAMMFFFGFIWGVINLGVMAGYFGLVFSESRYSPRNRPTWFITLKVLFNLFIMLPIALFLVIMPFFGGWIVLPLEQIHAWNHRCDGYPMNVVLDGKGYHGARFAPDVARFYQTGNAQSFYTYDISNSGDTDFWSFHLRTWDVDQSEIPLNMYPTLQQISYNFINNTVTGNCTIPVAPGASNTTIGACVGGSLDLGEPLSFNLTSAVPLNNTANPSSTPSTTTLLRTVDKQWSFGDDAPSLILRDVNPANNQLMDTVLRTAVTKKGDCTQLKVCLAGLPGEQGSVVGGPVMVPLGLMLMRQADYAIACTTPSDD
ncbi:unnamed protein product [Somion occarium]|uniref:Uncharacterized protein n=1 Tax=Somion occarium TaxID=3059160 RepID=A0ABP1D3B7_9APHY